MPRAIETIDINTTVLHYEETIGGVTETVAYLPLRKDSDGVVVVRDVCLAGRRINPTNVSNYIDSEMDSWLIDDQAGYLSYFDVKMRPCIIPTTIKVKPYDSDDITEIARQTFLLSTSEVGFTGVADEGESILPVLKSHRDTTNDNTARIAYNSAGAATNWWLRSAYSAEQLRYVITPTATSTATLRRPRGSARAPLLRCGTAQWCPTKRRTQSISCPIPRICTGSWSL